MGLRLGVPLCSPIVVSSAISTLIPLEHMDSTAARVWDVTGPCHASLNELVKRALATIEVPSVLEPVSLCCSDGKRPDGISTIPCMEERKATGVGCNSVGQLCSLLLWTCMQLVKLVLWLTWLKLLIKRCLYSELAVAHHFVPIGIDSLGVFGDSARSFFKELGCRTRTLTGDPQSYHKLCQRISSYSEI